MDKENQDDENNSKGKREEFEQTSVCSNPVVSIHKSPPLITVTGPLSKTNRENIFTKIYYNNLIKFDDVNQIMTLLQNKLQSNIEKDEWNDMALINLLEGCNASIQCTGEIQPSIRQLKKQRSLIPTYNLKNAHIVTLTLYYHLFDFYMMKNKPGNAHCAVNSALYCIQSHAPNCWTSLAYKIQGLMFDRLAQAMPKYRKTYRELALKAFLHASDDYLQQSWKGEENYLYYPTIYLLDRIYVILDMPAMQTVYNLCGSSNIVYSRLLNGNVSEQDIDTAQVLLKQASEWIKTFTQRYERGVNEFILIGIIYSLIRKTQLDIHQQNYVNALQVTNHGFTLYKHWSDFYNREKYNNTRFKNFPQMPRDVKKILEHLQNIIVTILGAKAMAEECKNSLSSSLGYSSSCSCSDLSDDLRKLMLIDRSSQLFEKI